MVRKLFYKLKWSYYHKLSFVRSEEIFANEQKSLKSVLFDQEIARQNIVRTALKVSKFYRQHYFAAGFNETDIGKPGWFEKLPIVTKQNLREHFEEFINPETRQFMRISTTGGSTGTPTKVGYDGRVEEEIFSWRLQNWFGVNPWDDHAYIWRDTRTSKLAQIKNALLWWPTKHLKLNASFITDEAIVEFLNRYRKVKPTLLQGYVGAVVQVAQYVLEHKVDATNPRLKCIWTTSAPISSVQRKLIEHAFGAKVCDQYGSCEIRWIAQQCAEVKGLHVNTEHVHIEFVDENNLPVPKDEYGKTLLTDLENTVFPLIRYENGDRGRWLTEPCSCGCALPCIDSVKGREVESFILPSGKTINGEFLTTIFDATPEVATNFRVVQHKDLSITVEYVPGSMEMPNSIPENFNKAIDGEVKVKFKVVDSIAHDRGKLRFVVREK